jgi:hypothetical protein
VDLTKRILLKDHSRTLYEKRHFVYALTPSSPEHDERAFDEFKDYLNKTTEKAEGVRFKKGEEVQVVHDDLQKRSLEAFSIVVMPKCDMAMKLGYHQNQLVAIFVVEEEKEEETGDVVHACF